MWPKSNPWRRFEKTELIYAFMAHPPIPYAELETVFLGVGNTLVSMDYAWILDELAKRVVVVPFETLQRAEAASRPAISRAIAGEASTEGLTTFELYLKMIVTNLGVAPERRGVLVRDLVPVFRGPGREKLWSCVLPGVPEALEELRALGLRLVVVSNSDGSVEQVLGNLGLRPYLERVFDSHIVGYEKPDPRFFQHALDETDAKAATTLHIGDLYVADIKGGRAAGVHTALVDPFDDWEGVDCTRFRDLTEASEVIQEARS